MAYHVILWLARYNDNLQKIGKTWELAGSFGLKSFSKKCLQIYVTRETKKVTNKSMK